MKFLYNKQTKTFVINEAEFRPDYARLAKQVAYDIQGVKTADNTVNRIDQEFIDVNVNSKESLQNIKQAFDRKANEIKNANDLEDLKKNY